MPRDGDSHRKHQQPPPQQQQRAQHVANSAAVALRRSGDKCGAGASCVQAPHVLSKPSCSNVSATSGAVQRDFNANNVCVGGRVALTPTPFAAAAADTKVNVASYSLRKDEHKAKSFLVAKGGINSTLSLDLANVDGVSLAKERVTVTTKPATLLCSETLMACTDSAAAKESVNDNITGCTDDALLTFDDKAVAVAGATNNNTNKNKESTFTAPVEEREGQEVKQKIFATESVEESGLAHHRRSVHADPVSTTTAATTTAPAATVTLANCARPALALSVHLVSFYKQINEAYCRQRRLQGPGPKYNNGYDDSDGHYLVIFGEEIFKRYTVQKVLGKGSFGTVLRCYDEKRRENVALKITRNGLGFRTQAKLELDILLKLSENHNLSQLVVRLLKVFDWQGHIVLVFELLSLNLYQLTKYMPYNGVTLDLVRKFAYQLVQVLYQLERTKPNPVIHCDIKPENILLKNKNRSSIRLIDFGSACYSSNVVHKYIQSRYYRSPEVILYLEYGPAIDRWSLACVLVELHTGVPLFDGRTEAAQLALFDAMLGPIPVDMLEASPKVLKFYEKKGTEYKLKEPSLPRRLLETVLGVTTGGPCGARKGVPGHSEEDYRQFHSFIDGLLRYRPSERMSCYDALRHPFLEPLWAADKQKQRQQQLLLRQPQKAPVTTQLGCGNTQ